MLDEIAKEAEKRVEALNLMVLGAMGASNLVHRIANRQPSLPIRAVPTSPQSIPSLVPRLQSTLQY